jgi:hypothetical protein
MKSTLALAVAFVVTFSAVASAQTMSTPATGATKTTVPGSKTPGTSSSDIQFPGVAMPAPGDTT